MVRLMCPSHDSHRGALPMSRTDRVVIRPARLADRRAVYEWMAHSDITSSMMGPPIFPDAPVPTWEQFCADYVPCYFDGTDERFGRSYIIEEAGRALGHISYSRVEAQPDCYELDVWMRSLADCSRGLGSTAIDLLCRRLRASLGVSRFIMRPSARNARAIRAYRKAGFEIAPMTRAEQDAAFGPGDYEDTVTLARSTPNG